MTVDRQHKGGMVSRMTEWIVALGIVALFVVMVAPALTKANRHREIVRVTENGQRLRDAIVRANERARVTEDMSALWPSNSHAGSTEYFLEFFQSGLYTNEFPVDWLAAPGVPAFSGTNLTDFAASNNAWCISVPMEGQTNDFPFLFTRNFSAGEKRGAEKGMEVAHIERLDSDSAPFGGDVGIVVSYRGVAQVIKPGELSNDVSLRELFNPTSATNRFLTPWSPRKGMRGRRR